MVWKKIKPYINYGTVKMLAILVFVGVSGAYFSYWIYLAFLVVLFGFALYRIWQQRLLIVSIFNQYGAMVRGDKFKPYIPKGDVNLLDMYRLRRK